VPQTRQLATPHRCRGGAAYLQWIETLLHEPSRLTVYRATGSMNMTSVSPRRPTICSPVFATVPAAPDCLLRLLDPAARRSPAIPAIWEESAYRKPNLRSGGLWNRGGTTCLLPRRKVNRADDLRFDIRRPGFRAGLRRSILGDGHGDQGRKMAVGDPEDCYDQAPGLELFGQ